MHKQIKIQKKCW